MSKHTRGPWRVSGVGPTGSVRLIYRATGETTYPVATVQLDSLDRLGAGDTDATANLISAAPEMLEALELVFRTARGLPKNTLDAVTAAIAKARSEL